MKIKPRIMKTLVLLIISCMLLPVFPTEVNAEKGDNLVLECLDKVCVIAPGEERPFEISVTNLGSDDTIEFSAVISSGWNYSFIYQANSVNNITLKQNETKSVTFFIYVPEDAGIKEYFILIFGESSTESQVLVLTMTVKESYDIEINAEEKTIVVPVGERTETSIELRNIGENEGYVNLSVSSVLVDIESPVFLSIGESKNISLLVHAPFNFTYGNYPVNITAAFYGKNVLINITVRVVRPTKILLVEKEMSQMLRDALNDTFYNYDIANLSRIFLCDYNLVIWYCGKSWFNTISLSEQQNLSNYLDKGGSLWLIGQDVLDETGLNDFVVDYLHVAGCEQNTGINRLIGVSGDPIGDGVDFPVTENWFADSITPDGDSFGIFYGKNNYSAIRYSGIYDVVFFAFDFSYIQNENDRNEVVNRVVAWFIKGEEMLTCVNNVSRIAPGNSTDYTISVKNNYNHNITVNFTIDAPLRWEASFNKTIIIGANETKNITLTVTCPSNTVMGDYTIGFFGKSQNGVTDSILLVAKVSLPYSVLLVNDCESSLENILNSTFYYYDVFDVELNGPNATVMEKYDAVIWDTGKEWENTLTGDDQENIIMYLENGGNLFLIGQDILHDIYNNSNDFVKKYLRVDSADEDVGIPNPLIGMNPVFDNANYVTNPSSEDFADDVMPDNDSFGVFYGKNNYSAIGYSGVYRVVFFAFDFSFIPNENDKNEIIETVLGWLSEKKPDLAVSGINVSVSNPKEGDNLVFSVNISNKGNQDAYDVNVLFTVDNIVIGEKNISLLKSGERKTLTFEWKAVKGEHVISVFVDPENRIDESNETNSVAKMLFVEEKKAEAWPSASVIYAVMILCVFAIVTIILLRKKR